MQHRKVVAIALIAAALELAGCGGGGAPSGEAASGAPASGVAPAGRFDASATLVVAGLTGDPTRGQRVFLQCRSCHAVQPGQNLIGPTLHGVVGRRAGAVPEFRYSQANRTSDVTWSEEQLFGYLENPRRFLPGTTMSYAGLRNPQQRADVIAYLRAAS